MAQYTKNPPLLEANLLPEPKAQLELWLTDAQAVEMIEPTAMTLATVSADGRPSARMVLFKGFQGEALSFFSNYESHKGTDLAANPRAALVFWWDKLERQVRVEGTVKKLPRDVAEEYFRLRPRYSQIGSATSRQSRVVASREELDARFEALSQQLGEQPVPLPDVWGGFALQPEYFEFWQGRHGRLHDRLTYRRRDARWIIERLEP
jgi:pyridoxamine 5'-phosphate oxidase